MQLWEAPGRPSRLRQLALPGQEAMAVERLSSNLEQTAIDLHVTSAAVLRKAI